MGALSMATSALKNFQPTASVMAGGGASLITFAIGCALVAAGISIPVLNIPITMTMVAAASPTIGHFVSSIVPDTYNQQINAIATKLKTSVDNVKVALPQTYSAPEDFKNPPPIPTPNNLG